MIGLRKATAVAAVIWVAARPAGHGPDDAAHGRHADIKILDPIWTTALITRNHGYMVYDVLFAKDADLKIQPQMAEKVSDDKLTYTFTLRDGLEWSDGTPVTSGGLHRLDQALGRARRLWPAPAEGDGRTQGDRRQDLRHRAQGAVRPGARRAGQGLVQRAVHDAQAGRRDRSQQADRRLHRLRSLHLQEGRMEGGREGRLRQEPEIQAAPRAALDAGRRQGRQGRPRRMARHSRPQHGGQRPARGRDRPHRDRRCPTSSRC